VNIPGLKQPGEKISYSDDMPEDLTKMTLVSRPRNSLTKSFDLFQD